MLGKQNQGFLSSWFSRSGITVQPDVQQLLRQAQRRRINGVLIVLLASLAVTFLALHYRLYSSRLNGLLLPTWYLLVIWTSASQRGDKLILWLRRFHIKRPGGMRFDRLLQGASSGFGYPLTVQDSTLKSSLVMAAYKLQVLFTPLMLGSFVVLYAMYRGFISAFGPAFPYPLASSGGGVVFWLILGVLVVVCGVVFVYAFRRLGYVRLNPVNARETTLRVIHKIEKRRGWHLDIGVFVIHCDDSFWREIVQLCLNGASATVIDVTELSENVFWELETAFQIMAPQSIVLACGVGEGSPKELPVQVRDQLLMHLPAADFARAQTFFYPLYYRQMGSYPWGRQKDLRDEMQLRLASAIAQCSSSAG